MKKQWFCWCAVLICSMLTGGCHKLEPVERERSSLSVVEVPREREESVRKASLPSVGMVEKNRRLPDDGRHELTLNPLDRVLIFRFFDAGGQSLSHTLEFTDDMNRDVVVNSTFPVRERLEYRGRLLNYVFDTQNTKPGVRFAVLNLTQQERTLYLIQRGQIEHVPCQLRDLVLTCEHRQDDFFVSVSRKEPAVTIPDDVVANQDILVYSLGIKPDACLDGAHCGNFLEGAEIPAWRSQIDVSAVRQQLSEQITGSFPYTAFLPSIRSRVFDQQNRNRDTGVFIQSKGPVLLALNILTNNTKWRVYSAPVRCTPERQALKIWREQNPHLSLSKLMRKDRVTQLDGQMQVSYVNSWVYIKTFIPLRGCGFPDYRRVGLGIDDVLSRARQSNGVYPSVLSPPGAVVSALYTKVLSDQRYPDADTVTEPDGGR